MTRSSSDDSPFADSAEPHAPPPAGPPEGGDTAATAEPGAGTGTPPEDKYAGYEPV